MKRRYKGLVTPEKVAAMIAQLRAGEHRVAVAAEHHMSRSYVDSLAKRNGIPASGLRLPGDRGNTTVGQRNALWARAIENGPVIA